MSQFLNCFHTSDTFCNFAVIKNAYYKNNYISMTMAYVQTTQRQ